MTRNDSDAYEYLVNAVGDLNGPQILSVSISLSLSLSTNWLPVYAWEQEERAYNRAYSVCQPL